MQPANPNLLRFYRRFGGLSVWLVVGVEVAHEHLHRLVGRHRRLHLVAEGSGLAAITSTAAAL